MSSTEEIPPPSRPQSSHTNKSHKLNMLSSSSNLRDTLSTFGDDLVRVKDSNFLYFEGIQATSSDISGQQRSQIQFERVPSAEVGVKSSRWRKAIVAGLFTTPKTNSKRKDSDLRNKNEDDEDDNYSGFISVEPPFWGVGQKTREKISMLSLQLVLHELACFSSCVLLGYLSFHVIKGSTWNGDDSNWIFNRSYESIGILLIGLTTLGFLIRIDTTDSGSLLTSPFHILPTVLIVVPIYLVKAWELQREECFQYLRMRDEFKKHVHLTQNCEYYEQKLNETSTNNNNNSAKSKEWLDVSVLVMNIIPIIVCFIVSIYLFSFRNRFYLIEKFGNSKNYR